MLIHHLALRRKLIVNDSLAIKKTNQHAFDLRLAHSWLFLALERLKCDTPCSGALFPGHTHTQDSSPIITRSKKWGSFSIAPKNSRHLSFLMSFCSAERFFGPIFAQIFFIPNSLVKLWWTVVWGKFNSSPFIRTVKRRSERRRARILSTFASVLADGGLPLRDLSSIDSLPSKNALNHLKARSNARQPVHYLIYTSRIISAATPTRRVP